MRERCTIKSIQLWCCNLELRTTSESGALTICESAFLVRVKEIDLQLSCAGYLYLHLTVLCGWITYYQKSKWNAARVKRMQFSQKLLIIELKAPGKSLFSASALSCSKLHQRTLHRYINFYCNNHSYEIILTNLQYHITPAAITRKFHFNNILQFNIVGTFFLYFTFTLN